MAWLNGWQYRKKITISGSSGAGTNYQVLLKVGESSGASGYNFHVNGHSANFPSDIRFTADDGTTLLSFWVEQVTGTSPNRTAYVWVKVAADLGTDKYIYCYYGNPNATNASSVENTFIRVIDGNQPVKGSWHFDEGSGTIAYDKSGNNNNGTLYNGVSWTDGKFGNALSFDGINDYVLSGPSKSSMGSYLTIEMWVKPQGAQSGIGIFQWADTLSSGVPWILLRRINTTTVSWYLNGNYRISITANDNLWYHFVLTYDGSIWRAFSNGVFVDSYAGPIGTYGGNNIYLGNGYNGYFRGIIDEVRVYNRALTAAEISDLYNNYGYTTTNYPGRVLVRKYVSPEPAFSFADAEEIVVGIIKHIRLSKYIKGLGLSKYFKFD